MLLNLVKQQAISFHTFTPTKLILRFINHEDFTVLGRTDYPQYSNGYDINALIYIIIQGYKLFM